MEGAGDFGFQFQGQSALCQRVCGGESVRWLMTLYPERETQSCLLFLSSFSPLYPTQDSSPRSDTVHAYGSS